MSTIKTVGIIGYGRFGLLLESLIKKIRPSIDLKIYSRNIISDSKRFFSFNSTVRSDLVIPAVPIHSFENVIKKISKKVKPGSIVMDVCSVKTHPIKIMEKYLPLAVTIIASHPLFGPKTVQILNNRLSGLSIVMQFVRGDKNKYEDVKKIFKDFDLKIIEMDATSHDKYVAKSQFPAHIIGNIAAGINLLPQVTDTKSNEVLNNFLIMIQADPKLLIDIYRYNPYCKKELQKIERSFGPQKVLQKGKGSHRSQRNQIIFKETCQKW